MNLLFDSRNKVHLIWSFVLFLSIISIFHGIVFTDGQREQAGIDNREPKYYTNYEVLDKEGKYVLEWVVNWNQKRILFNVTVQTRGYVGFGLSAKGLMNGADIVIGGVTKNGEVYFTDRHGIGHGEPVIDKRQDWGLHSAVESGGYTFLSFSRAFDTCDENDYPINVYDSVNVIWSYGEIDETSQYHFNSRGSFPVYLLDPTVVPLDLKKASFQPGPPLPSLLAKHNLKLWTMPVSYTLPTRDTSYACTIQKFPEVGKKYHGIGLHTRFENPEMIKNIHHTLLWRCTSPKNTTTREFFDRFVGAPADECLFPNIPQGKIPTQYCTGLKHAYGIGARIHFFPDHLGIPFGETLTDEYFVLQIHYDNGERKSGIQVDVSFDVYYTDDLRPNDGGLMTVGHQIPADPSILIPPKSLAHTIFGHCGPTCTNLMFPPEGINISLTVLHTHYSGKKVKIRHFRGDRELPWVNNDDNYDNRFQSYRLLNNERNVLPTDQLSISCEYDNTWTNGTVVGGFRTAQEMCLIYMIYYNNLPDYTLCRSDIVNPLYAKHYLGVENVTWSFPEYEFVATAPPDLAGLSMSKISDTRVNWTKDLRTELQNDHKYMEHRDICSPDPFASTGGGEAGDDAVVSLPRNVIEWQPPPRQCLANGYKRRIQFRRIQ